MLDVLDVLVKPEGRGEEVREEGFCTDRVNGGDFFISFLTAIPIASFHGDRWSRSCGATWRTR
jgi:hypothetical protein